MKKLISSTLVLLLAGVSPAQHCGSISYPSYSNFSYYQVPTTYQYPVKEVQIKEVVREVPIAVPISVLVPSYQYTYQAPCVQPQQTTAVQPVAQAATHQQASVSSVSPCTSAPNIKEIARAVAAELGNQTVQGNTQDNGPPAVVDNYSGIGNSQQVSYNNQQANAGYQPQTAQATSFMEILHNKCSQCHTGSSSKSGIMIFSSPGQFNPSVDRQRLLSAIEGGRMPPRKDAPPLNQQEMAIVQQGLSTN